MSFPRPSIPLRKCTRVLPRPISSPAPRFTWASPHNHSNTRIRPFHSTPITSKAVRSPAVRRAERAAARVLRPTDTHTEEGLWKLPAQGDLGQRLKFLNGASKYLFADLYKHVKVRITYDMFYRISQQLFDAAYIQPPNPQVILDIARNNETSVNIVFKVGHHVSMGDMSYKEWLLASCALAGATVPVIYQASRYVSIMARTGVDLGDRPLLDELEHLANEGDPRAVQLCAQILDRRGETAEATKLMKQVVDQLRPSLVEPRSPDDAFLIATHMDSPWKVYRELLEKAGDTAAADEALRTAALEYQDVQALQDYAALMMREMNLEKYEEYMSKAASSGDVTACLKLANFYHLTARGWFPRRGVQEDQAAKPKGEKTANPAQKVGERSFGVLGRVFSFLFADVKTHAEYRKLAMDWYEVAFTHGSTRAAMFLAVLLREDGQTQTGWEMLRCAKWVDIEGFLPKTQNEMTKVWLGEDFPEIPLRLFDL